MSRRQRVRIDNKRFVQLIREFEAGKQASANPSEHPIGRELAQMVDNLVYNISTHPWFNRYTYKEEFPTDALIASIKAIRESKFGSDRDNAYGYFTKIIFNAFFKVLADEKKQVVVKNALYEEFQMTHANSIYTEQNDQKAEVYKKESSEHSEFYPIKVTKDGQTTVYNTKDEYVTEYGEAENKTK